MPGAGNIAQSWWQPLPFIGNQWWGSVTSNKHQRLSSVPPVGNIVFQRPLSFAQCPPLKSVASHTRSISDVHNPIGDDGDYWSTLGIIGSHMTVSRYQYLYDIVIERLRGALSDNDYYAISIDLQWLELSTWRATSVRWLLTLWIPVIYSQYVMISINFDGNCAEVQWNSLLCHGISMGVNENQWLTVMYIDPHHPCHKFKNAR